GGREVRAGPTRRARTIVSQHDVEGAVVIDIGQGFAAIARVELFERGIDGERLVGRQREAVQGEQDLFAARQDLRLAAWGGREWPKPRAVGVLTGVLTLRTIELDLVRNRRGKTG